MIRRLALSLAEWSDLLARRVAHDDGPEQLARAESEIECWEVDHGELIDRTVLADVVYLDEHALRRSLHRHPAGSRRP